MTFIFQFAFRDSVTSRVMKRFAVSGMLLLLTFVVAAAQAQKPSPAQAPVNEQAKESKPPFTLRITNDQIIGISLKAQDIKLKDIAAELSRRLKIPILLTAIVEKHPITTNFSDLVLETAMQMVAPQVYIDYEIASTPRKQPHPVAR